MKTIFLPVLLFFCLLLSWRTASALAVVIEMGPIATGAFPVISFPARVVLQGEPVRDLQIEHFRVQEDGQPVTDFQLELRREPLQFALVLDSSGSVKDFVQRIRDGANAFIDGLGPRDEALVVRFATQVTLAQKRTADRDSLKNAVDGMHPAGGTRLYDAVWRGMDGLAGSAASCLVLFTDGKDELGPERPGPLSTHTAAEIIQRAKEKGIPFYVIGVGSDVDRDGLNALAENTGGRFFYSPDPGKLVEIYRNLSRYLNVSYVFRYTTANSRRDGKWRVVEVLHRDSAAKAEGRYRVSEESPVTTQSAAGRDSAGKGSLKLNAPSLNNSHLSPPRIGSTDLAPPTIGHTGDIDAPQLQGVPGWTAEDQAAMDSTYDGINRSNRRNMEDTNRHLTDTYRTVNEGNRRNAEDVNRDLEDEYGTMNHAGDAVTDEFNTDTRESIDAANERLEELPGLDMELPDF